MTAELHPVEWEPPITFLPDPSTTERLARLAKTVQDTEFVPADLRGRPAAILAAMLTGREVGIGPMHALRGIDVIDGTPNLSPEVMASLVLRRGHDIYPVSMTSTEATIAGRRREWPADRPPVEVTWTLDDARRAGLVGVDCAPEAGRHVEVEVTKRRRDGSTYTKMECGCRQGWKTYPRALLRARATSEVCRAIFPDVVERVGYVAEEVGGVPAGPGDGLGVAVEVTGPERAGDVIRGWGGDPVADHLTEVARWNTAGIAGHLRKRHGADADEDAGRGRLVSWHADVHQDGDTPDAVHLPDEPADEDVDVKPSARRAMEALVGGMTVDQVKEAVVAGDVDPATALDAELVGKQRSTLIGWLRAQVYGDEHPAPDGDDDGDEPDRTVLLRRWRVAYQWVQARAEVTLAHRLLARANAAGLRGDVDAVDLDRLTRLVADVEAAAVEHDAPTCPRHPGRPSLPGHGEGLCGGCADTPM